MGVGTGLYMYDVVVKKFTFAISSPDEFLYLYGNKKASNRWQDSARRQFQAGLRGDVEL